LELRKIVVGVDFTDASLAAARWAAAHFAPDAEIVLVHMVGSTFTLWLPLVQSNQR
jgi:hypothetical protein